MSWRWPAAAVVCVLAAMAVGANCAQSVAPPKRDSDGLLVERGLTCYPLKDGGSLCDDTVRRVRCVRQKDGSWTLHWWQREGADWVEREDVRSGCWRWGRRHE
jgi:hypothetical protein